jgi:hypothetical protein
VKTYEDLLEASDKMAFVREAINAYKTDAMYVDAFTGYEYFRRRNTTISRYQKLLYKMSGEAVPDNYSANYKFSNAFFPIFVRQENSYLLGNGVTFNEDSTKDKLGGDDFDGIILRAGEASLWGGVAYGFWNLDHVEVFKATEFAPLFGEEDGGIHAGIRFWQIAGNKPLRATLYEEDGYTEYIWKEGEGSILKPKQTYKQIVRQSVVDGTEIIDGENYAGFPIVPLWANSMHQTELIGLQSKIDGYDLIQSGLANDLDDASQIYWTLQNAGGMDDIDLAAFLQHMKTVKAAIVDDDGAKAEAHTIDVPYQARQAGLQDLRDSLYRDAMALDTDKITAGSVTATAINAAYDNLNLKCDDFEACVTAFIKEILALIGVDDAPTYKRSKLMNQTEETQVILSAAQFLDDETVLKHLPFISPDEIESILGQREQEEMERFESIEDEQSNEDEAEEQNRGQGQTEDR